MIGTERKVEDMQEMDIMPACEGAALLNMQIGLAAAAVLASVLLASKWLVLEKAGKRGWAALVPFYGSWLLYDAAFEKGWTSLLAWIPFLGAIMHAMLCFQLAWRFGKGNGFGAGLCFLPFVFLPILAFGKAEYGKG